MRRLVLLAAICTALTAAAVTVQAQTTARPAAPVTLLTQLRSTHDHADWFTPTA